MKKKLFAGLLALCMVLSLMPMAALAEPVVIASGKCGAAGTDGDNLIWELTENKDTMYSHTHYKSGDSGSTTTVYSPHLWAEYNTTGLTGTEVDQAVAALTLTITGEGEMKKDYTAANVPWASYRSQITQISLPDGLTHIGQHTLRQTSVSKLDIPSTVETIGDYALIQSLELTELTGPGRPTSGNRKYYVEDNVVYEEYGDDGIVLRFLAIGAYTSEFNIPDGVTALGPNSMQRSTFTSVVIPDSVRSINSFAFNSNTNLTSVTLPDNVDFGIEAEVNASPGTSVFSGVKNLSEINNFPSVKALPDGLFNGVAALTEFTIPESVEKLGMTVFQGTGITELTIPASVTSIGAKCFGASAGQEITRVVTFAKGSKLTSAGALCFNDSPESKAVFDSTDIDAYLTFLSAGNYAEIDGSSLVSDGQFRYVWVEYGENKELKLFGLEDGQEMPETMEIPDTVTVEGVEYPVTSVAGSAFFFGDNNLEEANTKNIIIGANIEEIGDHAFQRNSLVESVDFSKAVNLKRIGSEAFYNDTKITVVDLSNCTSLTSIGDKAFYSYTYKTITLPDGISSWGDDAVGGKTNSTPRAMLLCNIGSTTFETLLAVLQAEKEKFDLAIEDETFTYVLKQDDDGTLYAVVAGFAATATDEQKANIAIPDTVINIPVTEIKANAFEHNPVIESVRIGKNVSKIGKSAFNHDKGGVAEPLTSVVLSEGVAIAFDTRAFAKQANLETFDAGERVITSVGDNTFMTSPKLKTVNIPNVKALGKNLFYASRNIAVLVINGSAACETNSFLDGDDTTTSFKTAKVYIVGEEEANITDEICALADAGNTLLVLNGGSIDINEDVDATTGLIEPDKDKQKFVCWLDADGNELKEQASGGAVYYASYEDSEYKVTVPTLDDLVYGYDTPAVGTITVSPECDSGLAAVSSNEAVFTAKVEDGGIIVTSALGLGAGDYSETVTVTTPDEVSHKLTIELHIDKEASVTEPAAQKIDVMYGEEFDITVTTNINDAPAVSTYALITPDLDTVDFYIGEEYLGTADVVYDGDEGTATLEDILADKRFAIGDNTVNAYYGGSANLLASDNTVVVDMSKREVTAGLELADGVSEISRVYNGSNHLGDEFSGLVITLENAVIGDNVEAVRGGNFWYMFKDAKEDMRVTGYVTLIGDDAGYYELTNKDKRVSLDGVGTITPAQPVVTLADKQATYNGTPVEIGAAIVTLVNSEVYDGNITYTYTDENGNSSTDAPIDAGTYSVVASIEAFGNYLAAESEASELFIDESAEFSLSGEAYKGIYDGKYHSIKVDAENGVTVQYSEDRDNWSDTQPEYKDVGNYTVYYKASKKNYKDYINDLTVVITPAPLTAKYVSEFIHFNQTPALEVKISGFVNGEDERVIDVMPTVEAPRFLFPTLYVLTPEGGEDNNYEFTSYESGYLIVLESPYIEPEEPTDPPAEEEEEEDDEPVYRIKIDAGRHGDVTTKPSGASEGTTITIYVEPDKGYALDELVVTDREGNELELKDMGDGRYRFRMPDSKVNIEAGFKKAKEEVKIVLTVGSNIATVNGETITTDVAPVIVNGRTMLPIRFIAEALGAEVEWVETERKVIITKGDTNIVIFIGSEYAYINGEAVKLDAAAFIEGNRTYLPLRFVAEALGADVVWDADARTVTITGTK